MVDLLITLAFLTWMGFWIGLALTPQSSYRPRTPVHANLRLALDALSALPVAWLLAFVLLLVRARIRFADWPFDGPQLSSEGGQMIWYPGPAEMPVHAFLIAALSIPAWTSIIWYPPLFAYLRRSVVSLRWSGPFLFGAGYLCCFFWAVLDPGGSWSWWYRNSIFG